jgi:hypothetical protein
MKRLKKLIPFHWAVGLVVGISTSLASFSTSVQAADIIYNSPPELVQAHQQAMKSRGPSRGWTRGPSRGGPCKNLSDDFSLEVLVPGSGYTVSAQPTLYWSTSQPVSGQFMFTVKPVAVATSGTVEFPAALLETKKDLSVTAGIQVLPLAQYRVSLEENKEYEWSVSLTCDAQNPSLNRSATGKIKRVPPPAKMKTITKAASESQWPYLYAEMGIWYDALDSLSGLIQKHPSDKQLREVRASLLKQGGLAKVGVSP